MSDIFASKSVVVAVFVLLGFFLYYINHIGYLVSTVLRAVVVAANPFVLSSLTSISVILAL